MELYKFVDQGGVLITEGGTSTVFPEYKLTPGRRGRDARQSVCPRVGLEDRSWRQEQSRALRLRSEYDGRLFQPGAGPSRWRRRRIWRRPRRRSERAARRQHAAQRRAADSDDAGRSATGAGAGCRRWSRWARRVAVARVGQRRALRRLKALRRREGPEAAAAVVAVAVSAAEQRDRIRMHRACCCRFRPTRTTCCCRVF